MKLKIFNVKGEEKGSKELPNQFNESFRPDLIKRAVLTIQSNKRQAYGSDPRAGKKHSAYVSKRRHDYRTTYGIGQSRTPRKVMSSRGTRFNWVGAFVPQTVGGRRAHPPKAEKIWEKKLNKKENRKAIRSALSACFNIDIIKQRNTYVPENYPFILSDDFQNITKTKEIKQSLIDLGFKDELKRSAISVIRAGIGKLRGRKYKKKKSLLFVIVDDCNLSKSARNIPGIDIAKVNELNAESLAPGTHPGRMTLFTESAIDEITKNNLFTDLIVKKETPKKKVFVKKVKLGKKKNVKKKVVKKKDKKLKSKSLGSDE
jgi:large subunit ribosomal protein L4e